MKNLMPSYLKIIREDENNFWASTYFGEVLIEKNKVWEIRGPKNLFENKTMKDILFTQEQFDQRQISYCLENKIIFISNDRTIWQNGREVKVSKLTEMDRFTRDLGVSTDCKVKKKWAIFPTTLSDGQRIWGKTYYALYGSFWGSGMHSGSYYRQIFTTTSLKDLGSYYLDLEKEKASRSRRRR